MGRSQNQKIQTFGQRNRNIDQAQSRNILYFCQESRNIYRESQKANNFSQVRKLKNRLRIFVLSTLCLINVSIFSTKIVYVLTLWTFDSIFSEHFLIEKARKSKHRSRKPKHFFQKSRNMPIFGRRSRNLVQAQSRDNLFWSRKSKPGRETREIHNFGLESQNILEFGPKVET